MQKATSPKQLSKEKRDLSAVLSFGQLLHCG